MVTRVATAAVGLPLLAAAVWFGSPWLIIVAAAAAAIGAAEVCRMATNRGRRPMTWVAALWAVAIVAAAHSAATDSSTVPSIVAALASLAAVTWAYWKVETRPDALDWRITLGSALYLGILLAHAPLLRSLDGGKWWVFVALGITFVGDTAALVVGKAVGRHQMAPTVSPGKTWEGAAGGWALSVAACVGTTAIFNIYGNVLQSVALGALMGVVGQVGDLAESRLKRLAAVKDSGWLLPGHGGLLDRLDSIVFNLPLVYYFVIWVVQ